MRSLHGQLREHDRALFLNGHQIEAEIRARLIAPNPQLPCQFEEGSRWERLPEYGLVLAFFWRAVSDLLNESHSTISRPNADDAKRWFHDRESRGPFSYLWACDYLGVDPDEMIGKIEALSGTAVSWRR